MGYSPNYMQALVFQNTYFFTYFDFPVFTHAEIVPEQTLSFVVLMDELPKIKLAIFIWVALSTPLNSLKTFALYKTWKEYKSNFSYWSKINFFYVCQHTDFTCSNFFLGHEELNEVLITIFMNGESWIHCIEIIMIEWYHNLT